MTLLRSSALRHLVALGLMLVLALAGVGRGLAAASDMAAVPGFGLAGVGSPICHTGDAEGSKPGDPARHDCCEACALLAPATLADAPALTGPASVVRFAAHAVAMAWMPTLARLRTPRQSQGPPAA